MLWLLRCKVATDIDNEEQVDEVRDAIVSKAEPLPGVAVPDAAVVESFRGLAIHQPAGGRALNRMANH